jgi:hypothetical protein
MKRMTATITSISYDLVNGIGVELKGMDYIRHIKPSELHFGGKSCEISQLKKGGKIEFDKPMGVTLRNVTIISDGIREVDTDGNLIKW